MGFTSGIQLNLYQEKKNFCEKSFTKILTEECSSGMCFLENPDL